MDFFFWLVCLPLLSLCLFFFLLALCGLSCICLVYSLFFGQYTTLYRSKKKKRRRKNGEYRLIWKNLKDQICETESGGSFLVKVALEFSVPLETRVLCLGSHLGEGLDVGLAKK